MVPRQGTDRHTALPQIDDRLAVLRRDLGGPAQRHALAPGTLQASVGALDQQVFFHFCDGRQHLDQQLAGRRCHGHSPLLAAAFVLVLDRRKIALIEGQRAFQVVIGAQPVAVALAE